MSKDQQGISDLLRELRETTARIDSPEEKQRLTQLAADIEARLDAHLNEDHQQELIDQMRDEVMRFEASHPDAAATIHNLVNMLSNLGL
jgi:hypothetical protein